ncbi:MAG: pantetheine-phosphate adenylyltransferase, partial [Anaerorhabdus sp.]
DFAKQLGAVSLIRGIRAVADYEYELQQATANMMLNDEIESIFFVARPEYSFLSSSVAKEIAVNGGDISKFIPSEISDFVLQELRK